MHHYFTASQLLDLDKKIVETGLDITEQQQVIDALNSIAPDVIVHLAAKALVPVARRDPRRTFETNILGTVNLIEACRRLRICERFLVVSTDHVFGNVTEESIDKGFAENDRVSYAGPYDTSKAAMELVVRSYYSTYWSELPSIGISRCANVFGFGDTNLRRVIPLFLSEAVNNGRIPLRYREPGRQFIHVADAVSGYTKALSFLSDGSALSKANATPPERTPFTPTFHFSIVKYEGTDKPFIRMHQVAQIVAGLTSAKIEPLDSREER